MSAVVSPSSLSGLAGWYDASDSSYLGTATTGAGGVSNGSTVAFVTDRSGRGRHLTQSTANNRPTFTTTGVGTGGLGALSFNGTNNFLTNATVPLSGASPAFSFFAVFSRSAATGGALGCFGLNVGDWFNSGLSFNYNVWFTDSLGASNRSPFMGTASQVTNTPVVVVATMKAGASWCFTFRRNGTIAQTAVNSTPIQSVVPTRSISVGSLVNGYATAYHSGPIAEIGFYDRELSDADAVALGRLLGTKHGVTVA